ncbi:hypothetical protein GPY23_11455 [Photorhabdus bodei]|uniref:Uncharacterized protein n=1 Tax=Photorhabdus bodei TaxID=2029681 RepID=A0A329X9B4_9GAMM|nr:hypothetical protein [Photorhabdus bodei]NDL03895.1 hypothetical protein [Photorhabdus bodei]NDL07946.1 hypothetical protein [Photorhabdus bodei]RAX13394.1 hypothetical protein CKY02_07145 [Photorhabdus bodei]
MKQINELLKDIERTLFCGINKPELIQISHSFLQYY